MKQRSIGRSTLHGRALAVALITAAIPIAAALPASAAAAARPTIGELREEAERFARIFEQVGTYPGLAPKGKVTLPPPAPRPTDSPPAVDLAWSGGFSLPVFDTEVTALVRYRGRWIAAGAFGAAPGTSANAIAEWDGQRWRDLGAGVTGRVSALATDGTSLYAGGTFQLVVNGVYTSVPVLRWTGDGWAPVGSRMSPGNVFALRVIRGTLYAAGRFYDGTSRLDYPLARWTGSAWERVGPALQGQAYTLAEHGGHLVLGGQFRKDGDAAGDPVVISLESPSEWTVLAKMESTYVRVNALESFGGKLYAAGGLRGVVPGEAAVASWDGATWTPENLSGYGTSLAISGGKLWLGGYVWGIVGQFLTRSGGIASLEGGEWTIPEDDPGGQVSALGAAGGRPGLAGRFSSIYIRRIDPNDPVQSAIPLVGNAVVEDRAGQWTALAPPSSGEAGLCSAYGYPPMVRLDLIDGVPWASGDFYYSRAGGAWRLHDGVARWSDGTWTPPAVPQFGYFAPPSQLIAWNGAVYAAFPYSPYYGSQGGALYRLGAAGWEAVPGAPPEGAYALAVHDGALIVAGRFTQAGGAPAASIARFDGVNWSPVGDPGIAVTAPEMVPVFTALLSKGTDLWAAGSFFAVGGVSARSVARWDGAQWRAAGEGLQSYVSVLGTWRGDVVAGGDFFYSGAEQTGGLARWDGAAWHRLGPVILSGVRALAEARGSLFAGGYISGVGYRSTALARFDGQRWESLGEGLGVAGQVSGDVRSLLPVGDKLWVSGRFSLAGGRPAYSVSTYDLRSGSFAFAAAAAPATPGVKTATIPGKTGARVSFALERDGTAELGVFDVRGARVRSLASGRFRAGTHDLEWDGRDAAGTRAAPGVYFLQLRVDGAAVGSGRVIVLR